MAGEWNKAPFDQLLIEPVRNGIYKTKDFHGRGAKIVNMGELFAHPRLRAVPMKPREIQEVRNAFAAYESMVQWQPDRVEDLLAAHGVMMTALVDDAGHWRRGGVGVMAGDKVIHMAPPASQVPRLMQDLLHWLANTEAHPPRRHSTTSSSSSIPSATETGAWGGCGKA